MEKLADLIEKIIEKIAKPKPKRIVKYLSGKGKLCQTKT